MKQKICFLLIAVLLAAVFLVGAPPAANAAEEGPTVGTGDKIYIDSSAPGGGNGTIDNPYNDLWYIEDGGYAKPGTTFYIKNGSVFNRGIFMKSSGTEGNPITITWYGDENQPRPVINGGTAGVGDQAAIRIWNQNYITVDGLTLSCYNVNDPDDFKQIKARRNGVWIVVNPYGDGGNENTVVKGITLRDLEITNITGVTISENFGFQGDGITATNTWVTQSCNAGIQVEPWQRGDGTGHMEDILIENCYVHDVNTQGINVMGYYANNDAIASQAKNVVVRNNVVYKTGCDGMIIGHAHSALIENNVVYNTSDVADVKDFYWTAGLWVWGCSGNTIVQQNEVAHTRAMEQMNNSDAAAFDTDIMSMGNYYWQYNYTHDNDGGFYFNMGEMAGWDANGVNYVRYNISVNDGRFNNFRAQINVKDPTVVSNNVFYNNRGSTNDLRFQLNPYDDGWKSKTDSRTQFINNIIYEVNATSDLFNNWTGITPFASNAIYGVNVPETDGGNLIFENGADMGLVNAADPGDAWTGIGNPWSPAIMQNVTGGFKLKADSPLIGAGKFIAENISTDNNGGRDYFGNSLYAGAPDIGAYEYPDDTSGDRTKPAAPTDLKATAVTDELVTLTWDAKVNGVPMDAMVYRNGTMIAYVVAGSTYTDTGLNASTEYTYKVVAVSNTGIQSDASAELKVTTSIASIVVNAPAGTTTGTWSTASGSSSYNDTYLVSRDPDATLTMTADVVVDGYYNLYYWMPNGNNLDTRNAEMEILYDGGSSKLTLDQRAGEGRWVLAGLYKFNSEDDAVVIIRNAGEGELNAGAIRLVYQGETTDTTGINSVELKVGTTLLKDGETTTALLLGSNGNGSVYDLLTVHGAVVEYILSKDGVISVNNGVITALSDGAVELSARVSVNGQVFTTEAVTVQVGTGLAIAEPTVTVENGKAQVKLAVSNFTQKDVRLVAIAAVYNADGMMTAAKVSDAITLKTLNATVFDLTVNLNGGETVKVFLWDTLEGMVPVTDAMQPNLN